jgi:DNA replication and repair protein RecF
MQIKCLQLINFRNYKKIDINFSNKPTVFLAGNTAGKTNLLQAISFLALAKSSFSRREEDLINWEENFTKVLGEIEKEREKIKIEITLIKSDNKFQKI